eukprot:CAMPEP_0169414766 /NCGR_PEP_ID=MMETSP1017-20121227/62152_1 /TAXON_ID=342587 /ORGANISM="Karlodinium micrum, Strain CCMP2283" /LENGTH=53 /DNA_ID=CAMNT_0009522445 /DNA_START=29 /DNA_END=190 /DNA_ORIENTATION=+
MAGVSTLATALNDPTFSFFDDLCCNGAVSTAYSQKFHLASHLTIMLATRLAFT